MVLGGQPPGRVGHCQETFLIHEILTLERVRGFLLLSSLSFVRIQSAWICYNTAMTDFSHRTALDLSAEEWKSYAPLQAIRQHHSSVRAQLAQRRRRAMRVARQAAALLRSDFSAQRVVLFGSLASRGGFTLWSDIDLAVWGVAPQQFFAAVAAVTGMSAEFKIDLVDLGFCPASLHKAIEQDGVDL